MVDSNLLFYWQNRASMSEATVKALKDEIRDLHIAGDISNKAVSQLLEVLEFWSNDEKVESI